MDPNEDQNLDETQDQAQGHDTGDNGTGSQGTDTQEDNDTSSADDQDQGQDQGSNKPPAASADDQGEEDLDEEDDDLEDFAPPVLRANGAPAGPGATPLDIRALPRDTEGRLIPDQANAKIEEYVQQRIQQAQQSFSQENEQAAKTRETLTSQWNKGFQKFPAVAKNRDLADYARDIHLRSIEDWKAGTGPYVSPLAAIKKADRMYKKAAKSGYQSAKTRRRVERAGQSETSTGKSSQGAQTSAYEAARKKALSRDPNVAAEGRLEIIKLRRAARQK